MNIIDLPVKPKHEVNVFQCPLVAALQLAKKHNMTLQFCPKCVHASMHGASSTKKWSQFTIENEAAIAAVNECLDKFNKLTGAH